MKEVLEFFGQLFSISDFPPRWYCGRWSDFHGWLYIGSDIAIWLSYFTIPAMLLYFIGKKKDVPFNRIFLLFGIFILACGLTHLLDAIIFWFPVYRLSALVRFITAIASIWTVIALYRVIPDALNLKSPLALEKIIMERTQALEERNLKLSIAHENLTNQHQETEMKVKFRTEVLEVENQRLKAEIAQLKKSGSGSQDS